MPTIWKSKTNYYYELVISNVTIEITPNEAQELANELAAANFIPEGYVEATDD